MAPVCAVVVAGGSGQRFGNPGGKQLVNVAGLSAHELVHPCVRS